MILHRRSNWSWQTRTTSSLAGLEYEFVLRNDLKFSDGSALTSGDFKWSWERALKKSIGGQ